VMKATDLWDRNDAPASWGLHLARIGAVVVEGLMRAGGVVVRQVTTPQASEVVFVDHNDVIETFPSNRADDALGEGILPGARGAIRISLIPRPLRQTGHPRQRSMACTADAHRHRLTI
jgi:hypothetical protein